MKSVVYYGPSSIVLCWVLCCSHVLASGPIYGTRDGYDVGGNNSVCIVSTMDGGSGPSSNRARRMAESAYAAGSTMAGLNSSDPNMTNAATDAVQTLNDILFADPPADGAGIESVGDGDRTQSVNPVQVELLSQCYNGTFVKLEAVDLESGYSMYRNFPYTFRISLRMNVTDMASSNPNGSSRFAGLFIRFAMCDALERGFCNPVVESKTPDNMTVAMMTSNVSSGETLVGVADPTSRTVFSQWAMPIAVTTVETNAIAIENLEVKFLVPSETPRGLYRFVMHSMMITLLHEDIQSAALNFTALSVKRLDTATKGDVPVINVADDPSILTMSTVVETLIYSLIGVYDVFVLVMLGLLIRFRNHDAIRLAQGPFLGALLVGALIGGTFTFTFMPEKDVYCMIHGPLVTFPFTFIGAILVTRLWRVYVTLSGAMHLGKSIVSEQRMESDQKHGCNCNFLKRIVDVLSFFAKVNIFRRRQTQPRKSFGHRQVATSAESAQLVFFLMMPQAIFQTVSMVIDTPRLELVFDDTGNVGRYYCERDACWVDAAGSFLAASMFILAVVLAWVGREVPSIFNEKDAIFHTATISALLVVINVVVVEITDQQFTSPDSTVFLQCATLLFVGTIIISNVVYPKILRARRGEKVVVGKLLRAYGNEVTESEMSRDNDSCPQRASAGTFIAGAPIVLRQDDPLPENIESQIHKLHTFFRNVGDKCASGHALTKLEWEQMRRSIAKLKTDLDRVTLDWDNDSFRSSTTPSDGREVDLAVVEVSKSNAVNELSKETGESDAVSESSKEMRESNAVNELSKEMGESNALNGLSKEKGVIEKTLV